MFADNHSGPYTRLSVIHVHTQESPFFVSLRVLFPFCNNLWQSPPIDMILPVTLTNRFGYLYSNLNKSLSGFSKPMLFCHMCALLNKAISFLFTVIKNASCGTNVHISRLNLNDQKSKLQISFRNTCLQIGRNLDTTSRSSHRLFSSAF